MQNSINKKNAEENSRNNEPRVSNHLFSDGNESDNADREFNIEEEKNNDSRRQSFFSKYRE